MSTRREVQFQAGYDYREVDKDKPAGQRRGCHGLTIRFLLHGDEGVVQFMMYTEWLPSWVHEGAWGAKVKPDPNPALREHYPMAADLGYHWPTPQYAEHMRMDSCDVLPQGYCYYDGSGLNAEPVMAALLREGDGAVWKALENYYAELRARAPSGDSL